MIAFIRRQIRQPVWALGLASGAVIGWAATSLPYVNWAPVVPPVDQHHLVVRNDGKGSGEFGAPRSGRRHHRGVDLEAPLGTPVRAIRSGTVVAVRAHRGFGRYVEVEHAGGLRSLYGHLQEFRVAAGQRVRQGQTIGTVGKTGNARHPVIKPHLHIEIVRGEKPIDPETLGLALVRLEAPTDSDDADGGE